MDGAQVTDERKLAVTISGNLKFEGMETALKHLFVSHPIHHKLDDIQIKLEVALYSKKYNQHDKKNKVLSICRKPDYKLNALITRAKYPGVLCAIPKCIGQITVHIIHNP